MAKGFSEEDVTAAAAVMSSTRDSLVRGAGGKRDLDKVWEAFRGRLARAVLSDTDIPLFLAFLCTNRARALVLEMAGHLENMILGAEGIRYKQTAVPAGAASRAKKVSLRMTDLLDRGEAPSTGQIKLLKQETTRFVKQHLVRNTVRNSRVQIQGPEASKRYNSARRELVGQWERMLRLLSQCFRETLYTDEILRPEAMQIPSQNLNKILNTSFDPEHACVYTLRVMAGLSSVEAMSRPTNPFFSLEILERTRYPQGATTVRKASGGVIASFTVHAGGREIDPRILGIRAGDSVVWGGADDTVVSVSATGVVLSGSIPASSPNNPVRVSSGASAYYRDLRRTMEDLFENLPTEVELERSLASREGETTAGKTQELMEYLAGVHALLSPLSESSKESLARQQVSVSEGDTVDAALLAYAPEFAESTKDASRESLDFLTAQGFDRAEDFLMEGYIDELMQFARVDAASYAGSAAIAAVSFSSTVDNRRLKRPGGKSRGRA